MIKFDLENVGDFIKINNSNIRISSIISYTVVLKQYTGSLQVYMNIKDGSGYTWEFQNDYNFSEYNNNNSLPTRITQTQLADAEMKDINRIMNTFVNKNKYKLNTQPAEIL